MDAKCAGKGQITSNSVGRPNRSYVNVDLSLCLLPKGSMEVCNSNSFND